MFSTLFADAPEPWQVGLQDPASPIMEGIIDLHHDIVFFLIIICSIVSWMLLRTVFLFKYERCLTFKTDLNDIAGLPSRQTHSAALEIVWTIIPSFILLFIGIPSFSLLYAMDELVDPVLTLKVIGHQWYWSYEYGDKAHLHNNRFDHDSYMLLSEDLQFGQYRLLETDFHIYLPTKVHVRLLVTSGDVLHSWAIPSLGIKVDACPGRLNQASLYIKRTGVFYGQCSEICGVNHAFMPIQLEGLRLDSYLFFLQFMDHLKNMEGSYSLDRYVRAFYKLIK